MRSLRTRIEAAEKTTAAAAERNKSEFEYMSLEERCALIQGLRDTWTEAELDRLIIENVADPVYVARLKLTKEVVTGYQ